MDGAVQSSERRAELAMVKQHCLLPPIAVTWLLERGADDGETALLAAAYCSHSEVAWARRI